MLKLRAILLIIISLMLAASSVGSVDASERLVYESNFSEYAVGSTPADWTILRNKQGGPTNFNPCYLNGSPTTWRVEDYLGNSRLVFETNGPWCVTEIAPTVLQSENLKNYILEYDLIFPTTETSNDKNVAFRYVDAANWYGFRFLMPDQIDLQKIVLARPYGSQFPKANYHEPFKPNEAYRIRITDIDNEITLSINGIEVFKEADDVLPILQGGIPVLQASRGSSSTNLSIFDNVRIFEVTDTFDVPYLSQRIPDETYDHRKESIEELGCALTSAAMVMQYHGLHTLPNSEELTVSSLNTWLSENNGYGLNGSVLFSKFGKLTKAMANIPENDVDFDALEYRRHQNPDLAKLDQELTQRPAIIHEETELSSSGSHFVVGKGVAQESLEYYINDPYTESRATLTTPPSSIASYRSFTPSNTDLSYMLIQLPEELQFSLVNSSGGQLTSTSSTIPNALSTLDTPILNQVSPEDTDEHKHWELDIPQPESETYQLTLTSAQSGFYPIIISLLDESGEEYFLSKEVFVPSTGIVVKLLYHDQDITASQVEFQYDVTDIHSMLNYYYSYDLIAAGKYQSIKAFLSTAERMQDKNTKVYQLMLNHTIWYIEKHQQRHIDVVAAFTIVEAINYLLQV